MKEIYDYFDRLWYTHKQADIYITLYRLGLKPASTIASVSWYERVWTYKVLQDFVDRGIVAESIKGGVKQFWIPDINLLKTMIQKKTEHRSTLGDQFEFVRSVFDSIDTNKWLVVPKIQRYEKRSWIESLYDDIYASVQSQWLISITFFATNTFESQLMSQETTGVRLQSLNKLLVSNHIHINSYIAQWSLIMEYVSFFETAENLSDLPAGHNAVNMFIVGKEVFLIIYKEQPIGLRLNSPEFARVIRFLLEQSGKTTDKDYRMVTKKKREDDL